MEHECKENDTIRKLGESQIFFKHEKWWISTDDGCCHTEINFCPYCGKKLGNDGYDGSRIQIQAWQRKSEKLLTNI